MSAPHEHEPDPSSGDDLPRELRDALDAMTRPSPDPRFRERLRAAFVSGALGDGATSSEAHGDARIEAELETALDAWAAPLARGDFRARCREVFLAGEAAPRERGRLLRFVPLAAAAAILLLILPQLVERLSGGSGPEAYVVNGRTVANPSAADIEGLLDLPGCRVVDGPRESTLMRYGDGLLLEIDAGSDFRVLSADTDGLALDLQLDRGALRVANRSEGGGAVVVTTPDGRIVLRGEAIGVDVLGDRGTCICCLSGEAQIEPAHPGSAPHEITGGDAAWLPRGEALVPMPGDLHHEGELEELHRAARTHFYY